MRRMITPTLALLIATGLAAQDISSDVKTKLDMAQDYLGLLGVKYNEINLDRKNKTALIQAFNDWRKASPSQDPKAILSPPPSSLVPSFNERFFRISSFKTDWAQAPQYVSGIPEGSTPGTPAQIMRNPNYALWSFGGDLTPSELYVSVADRISLCDAAKGIWNTTGLKCQDAAYLSASRPLDVWGRIASSMKVTVNTSQVPRFEAGVALSQTSIARGRDYTFTVQGSFDPALLFRTTAEWTSWGNYYSKRQGDFKSIDDLRRDEASPFAGTLGRLRPEKCSTIYINDADSTAVRNLANDTFTSCFERLSRGSKWHQTITTVLPKVDVKAYTAFDFLRTGINTFVPTPSSGRALYDITATWDLKKVISSAHTRAEALQAATGLTELKVKQQTAPGGWQAQIEMLYLDLLEKPGLAEQNDWWATFHELIYKHLASDESAP